MFIDLNLCSYVSIMKIKFKALSITYALYKLDLTNVAHTDLSHLCLSSNSLCLILMQQIYVREENLFWCIFVFTLEKATINS